MNFGQRGGPGTGPDDEKADGTRSSTRIIPLILVAVLGLVIAELVFALQDRHLAHNAFTISSSANDTANQALGYTSAIGNISSQINSLFSDVDKLQDGQTNLTQNLNALQSVVRELSSSLADATTSPTSTARATPTYSYQEGSGARNIPSARLIWLMVGSAAIAAYPY